MKKVPEDHNPLNRSSYCGEPGALVSYLYNDGSPDELAAIEAHVQTCDACTAELAALGDTREVLSAWSPPQTELGLTLAASDALPVAATVATMPVPAVPAAVAEVPWWRQSSPVWMQAVAASMVFAAGMTIGAGRGAAPATSNSVAEAGQPVSGQAVAAVRTDAVKTDNVSRGELADLERRLRADLARLSTASTPVQTAARSEDEALLKRVRLLLSESEERQRSELALRTAQVLRDIEIQRKVDMATVQQDIGQIQGTTGAELKQQRELYNMLMNRAGLQGR
jgi:anti-sigma factor RsiW